MQNLQLLLYQHNMNTFGRWAWCQHKATEQTVKKWGLIFLLFRLLAYQDKRRSCVPFLYPSGKPSLWVLEVWAFLISRREITVFGLSFRPNGEVVRLGWAALWFGGPVPIRWLNGVDVQRAKRGVACRKCGPSWTAEEKCGGFYGAWTPEISPPRVAEVWPWAEEGLSCALGNWTPGAEAQKPWERSPGQVFLRVKVPLLHGVGDNRDNHELMTKPLPSIFMGQA